MSQVELRKVTFLFVCFHQLHYFDIRLGYPLPLFTDTIWFLFKRLLLERTRKDVWTVRPLEEKTTETCIDRLKFAHTLSKSLNVAVALYFF